MDCGQRLTDWREWAPHPSLLFCTAIKRLFQKSQSPVERAALGTRHCRASQKVKQLVGKASHCTIILLTPTECSQRDEHSDLLTQFCAGAMASSYIKATPSLVTCSTAGRSRIIVLTSAYLHSFPVKEGIIVLETIIDRCGSRQPYYRRGEKGKETCETPPPPPPPPPHNIWFLVCLWAENSLSSALSLENFSELGHNNTFPKYIFFFRHFAYNNGLPWYTLCHLLRPC